MIKILTTRYEQFAENNSITHLTINLSASKIEIEKRYGHDFVLEC